MITTIERCPLCSGPVHLVSDSRPMRWDGGPEVQVPTEAFKCDACDEWLLTDQQLRAAIAELKRATEEAQRTAADVLGASPEQPTPSTGNQHRSVSDTGDIERGSR